MNSLALYVCCLLAATQHTNSHTTANDISDWWLELSWPVTAAWHITCQLDWCQTTNHFQSDLTECIYIIHIGGLYV